MNPVLQASTGTLNVFDLDNYKYQINQGLFITSGILLKKVLREKGDILFHPGTTQIEEVIALIRRTVEAAASIEDELNSILLK